MSELLYQKFMEETIHDGKVHEALACVGVEGILQEFELWITNRFTLVSNEDIKQEHDNV